MVARARRGKRGIADRRDASVIPPVRAFAGMVRRTGPERKRAEHRGTERSARQGKGRDWGAGRAAGVLPARRKK